MKITLKKLTLLMYSNDLYQIYLKQFEGIYHYVVINNSLNSKTTYSNSKRFKLKM